MLFRKLIAEAMMMLQVQNTAQSMYTIVSSMVSTLNAVPFTIMGMVTTSPAIVVASSAILIGAVVMVSTALVTHPISVDTSVQGPTSAPTVPSSALFDDDRTCPALGSVLFAGYQAAAAAQNETSNTSQLLLLAMNDLPGDLDFYLTNDIRIPMTNDPIGSLQVRTHTIEHKQTNKTISGTTVFN
jgi:hypothetical protein